MLTNNQKELLKQWEDSDDTQRKEDIKNHLAENIAEIPYINYMGPTTAQDVVQRSISKYTGVENYNESSHWRGAGDFLELIISILFNGFPERAFNHGVNAGINYTLFWRAKNGDIYSSILHETLEHSGGGATNESDVPYLLNKWSSPPSSRKERLRRIIELSEIQYASYDLGLDLISSDFGNVEVDEDYVPVHERDQSNTRPLVMAQEVKYAIKQTRERAELIAMVLNNPRNENLSKSIFGIDIRKLKWLVREYIELYRDYLKSEGKLPDENYIPDYNDTSATTRDPSKLNLYHWEKQNKR